MRTFDRERVGCVGLFGLWFGLVVVAAQPTAPAAPPPTNQLTAPSVAPPQNAALSGLVFDSDRKEVAVKMGEPSVTLIFQVTNTSPDEIVINQLYPSCGCTVAKMPAQPWKLAPGAHGPIEATTDTRGKTGRLTKTISVITSVGMKVLTFTVDIPAAPPPDRTERIRNIQAAFSDRQAVFKNDCIRCHVKPSEGKLEIGRASCRERVYVLV